MWRYLSLVVLLAAVAPVAALSAAPRATPHDATLTSTNRLDALWLVVSATAGLRISRDGGRHWATPHGLPARGSFYSVVADMARPGAAFVSNGDVYGTLNGGLTWAALEPAPGPRSPAGVTTLAADPRRNVLYAGGAAVVAYLPAHHRWQPWGRNWPAGVQPTALLATSAHGLYAAAGGRLYHTADGTAPWHAVPAPDWNGSTITAMALGPDGATPYLAVRDRGVWYLDSGGKVHQLGGGLPDSAEVYTMQSDTFGGDLYVATDSGLFARHLNASYDVPNYGTTWRVLVRALHDPIVALRPLRRGLLAVAQSGALYEGTPGKGQALSWRRLARQVPADGAPVVAALVGEEWQAPPPPPPLPAQFTRNCLLFGPGQPFDVCGPFRNVYIHFRYPVFGWPRARAAALGQGVVRQVFDNVWLEWTPRRGVYLAPLGKAAADHRVFPHPTPRQVQEADTAYIGGYYVDPLFYDFWRQYGGVAVFGDPISQRVHERSTNGTGNTVPVQYFANVRMEYHAELPPGSRVQLSDLGERR